MKAVITVVGHDSRGIIAKVSTKCADTGANIMDISQTILNDYFAMIMVVDLSNVTVPFTGLVDELETFGKTNGLDIRVMHEDVFNSMHRI